MLPPLHDPGVKLGRTRQGKLVRFVKEDEEAPKVQIRDQSLALKVLFAHSIGNRDDPNWVAPRTSKIDYLKLRQSKASRKAAMRCNSAAHLQLGSPKKRRSPKSHKRKLQQHHTVSNFDAEMNTIREFARMTNVGGGAGAKGTLRKFQSVSLEDREVASLWEIAEQRQAAMNSSLGALRTEESRLRDYLYEKGNDTLLEIKKRQRNRATVKLTKALARAQRRVRLENGMCAFRQQAERWRPPVDLSSAPGVVDEVMQTTLRRVREVIGPTPAEREEARRQQELAMEAAQQQSAGLLGRVGKGMLGRKRTRDEAKENLKAALKELGNGRLSRVSSLAYCSEFEKNRLGLVLAIATGESGQSTLSALLNAIKFVERMSRKVSKAKEKKREEWKMEQKRRKGWKNYETQVESRKELSTQEDALFEMLASQVQKEVNQRTRYLDSL